MIAEIHNKLSSTGSNLSDRLEDQLTGNVFGTLRYIPYSHGLRPILERAYFEKESHSIQACTVLRSIQDETEFTYRFWPRHPKGEIDLLLEGPTLTIGIEVKYRSGLSSDDDTDLAIGEDWMESDNQLARYQSILEESAGEGKCCLLLFLAPSSMGIPVYQNVIKRGLIQEKFLFGLLTWENVLSALAELPLPSDRYWRTAVSDIVQLLQKKGFEKFKGFESTITPVYSSAFFKYQYGYLYPTQLIMEGQTYEYR